MNATLSNIIMFAAGAAIGSLVAWKLTKTKYENLIDEEVESVKRSLTDYNFKSQPFEPEVFDPKSFDNEPVEGQMDFDDLENEEKKESSVVVEDINIEIISPEEFGETEGFKTITLNYYADEILADLNHNIVDDPDKYVGANFAEHFGEYEDDSVYVRNWKEHYEYEILSNPMTYAELVTSQYSNLNARVTAKVLETE